MQKVPLVGITTLPETQYSLVPKQGEPMNLKPADDYVAYDQTQKPQSDVDADIVFVGYGIEAPEYNWDDYKGVDVRGKVLLMLVNELPSDDPKFSRARPSPTTGVGLTNTKRPRARARWSDPDPSGADGELSVGSGAQFKFWRAVGVEAGGGSALNVASWDSSRRGDPARDRLRE